MYREGTKIELSPRQLEIVGLVQKHAPVTGEQIAELLGTTRPAIRSDLMLLVMLGYLDAKPKVGYFLGSAVVKQQSAAVEVTGMRVKDVMGIPVTLRETATVSDAVVTLFLENVGSLIVADAAGALVGIVSRKDLLKVTLGNAQAATVPLSMVMTRYPNVVTVSPVDTVLDAIRKMIEHQVDGLPVVQPLHPSEGTAKVEAIGRITKTTVTRLLLQSTAGEL
ncbi:helix-turn-helix transcriptional regulator [Cohnella thermotolerans]|uniref:helix-turn-helix transcriptional regulator n=1 Tax=Cohnella thermotolerans TaxID=329858 RepID=UPI00041AF69F|nr:helix-turn-helix transcriptional regulator [Cohnella thermotolerans]